ncbi:hypothetical protein CCR80_11080 [Rhodothalassium salexigens]|uniref:PAS domain-containing sensor histidine kinase n=1 Tax=Rhodothalassium salexigens TaxID=1086 RepID=UPI001912FC3A|nr:PAS domain-containing sensor histidine kinase [Rhodothalassium salexigens]MBK5921572.1 hypothetical protein [Rhodothalassium salexigens]
MVAIGAIPWGASGHAPLSILLVLVGCVAVIAALVSIRRRRVARRRKAMDAVKLDMVLTALDANRAAFVIADSWGRLIDTGGDLTRLLGRTEPLSEVDAIGAALVDDARPAFAEHLTALVDRGKPFRRRYAMADGERSLDVRGRRLAGTPNTGPFLALWLRDVTDEALWEQENRDLVDRLQQERDRLRALMDTAECPMWMRDRDLRLTFVNQAYADAVNADDADQVIARQMELVSDSARSPGTRDAAARARDLATRVVETHALVVHGERRHFEMQQVPMTGQDEAAIAGAAIDVTARAAVEADLARHLRSQSETLDNLSTPVALFGPDRHLAFCNSGFAQQTGLDAAFLEAKPDHEQVLEAMRVRRRVPEQADFAAWKLERLDHYKTLREPVEEIWHLPDETTLRVVTQPHPLGGLLWVMEDITDRLALQRSYNTQLAVQRETFNNLREGIAVLGSDGRVKLHNPAFDKLWRLDTVYMDTQPHVSDLLDALRGLLDTDEADWHEERDIWLSRLLAREFQTGRTVRADQRVVDWAFVPLPDGRLLCSNVDVTDTVEIQRALRERNEALETADRLKSEFVANISYELRTPLNSIIGFTELLQEQVFGPLNTRQGEYLKYIGDSADRLRLLIDDILDLAVIEAGGLELSVRRFPVGELLDNMTDLATEQSRKTDKRFRLDYDRDGIGHMDADRRRLLQCLYNMVTNALAFTEPGGTVVLSARRELADDAPDGREAVVFAVHDFSPALSDQDLEKMIAGMMTSVSVAGEGKASGLGLSLVRNLVDMHHGTLFVERTADNRTALVCRLPATLDLDRLAVASPPATAVADRAGHSVGGAAKP